MYANEYAQNGGSMAAYQGQMPMSANNSGIGPRKQQVYPSNSPEANSFEIQNNS